MQDDDGRVLALGDGPQTLRIDFGPAVPPDGIPKSAIQIIPEEVPPPLDDGLTFLPRDEPHTHTLGDPLDGAMDVLFYGRRDRPGIESEHEDLLLVDVTRALVGRREPHRRPAGRERERLCTGQGLAVEGLELGLEGEGAAHPGRQIALEVVDEVTRIHPAPLARLRAVDGERLAEPRIPERHHRLAEAHRHLPHALDRALRQERLDLRVGKRGRDEYRQEDEREQTTQYRPVHERLPVVVGPRMIAGGTADPTGIAQGVGRAARRRRRQFSGS